MKTRDTATDIREQKLDYPGVLVEISDFWKEPRGEGSRPCAEAEPREEGDREMLMFSGLETQGEINRLLDEIYGSLSRASFGEGGGHERWASRPGVDHPQGTQGQTLREEPRPPLRAIVQAGPNRGPSGEL